MGKSIEKIFNKSFLQKQKTYPHYSLFIIHYSFDPSIHGAIRVY